MVEVVDKEEDALFWTFYEWVCYCDCKYCSSISVHPVHNCTFKCFNEWEKLKDETWKKKLGLYEQCQCVCSECFGMPTHDKESCMFYCKSSKFNI